ncbi:SAM-dependent methyltransferase [Kiloniella antarctica]|uniref:SAM-dependent methyltransferase n=1 Tax=Kiloniella antarctica TaxID=1550907 RepID=A0ABW5BDM8_9PROT
MPSFENEYYELKGLLGRIENGLEKIGASRDQVSLGQLAQVDEFHFRGLAATKELIGQLKVGTGDHVLDAGSGLGGPARQLAVANGCRVTGVDLSTEYCATGRALNKWVGLQDLVRLDHGDVTDLSRYEDNSFDGAWTIHVGMNVENKAKFYAEIFRVLKPGTSFLIYDVVAKSAQLPLYFPMPWARNESSSFVVTIENLREELTGAGFDLADTSDLTAQGTAFIEQFIEQLQQADTPPPLGLNLVLGPIMKEIVPNMKRNFAEGRIGLISLLCIKPA